jgi:TonB-linked SusC/RagA family outer membrane protein
MKCKKSLLGGVLIAMLFCLITPCVNAQTKSVSGIVKDNTGEPLIGVSVQVLGTTTGTITDFDGKYAIQAPAKSKLQFSFIGYVSQTLEVGSQSTINVTLKEDNKTLDEVVVIGYGTVKRRDLTGSVASVTGDKLAANPVSNVAQALQGQLPGVSVTSQDGRPGGGMSIRVRGGGSITQSNDPLFIVDGVQVSGIDDIPADNIESIDVLKDAASTAIYGARGANGVILVTTKGGKEGKATVKYNMYYQIKENPETLGVLDAYDYVLWNWSYATALGSYGDEVAKYFGVGSANGNHLDEYKNVKAHNYVKDVMRTASSWNHDLSLSGGNDKTKYYAAINYTDDEGIRKQSSYSRWNANFKLTQKITHNLTFDADLRYSETETEGAKFEYASTAYKYRPIDNPLGDATNTAAFGNGNANVEENMNVVDHMLSYNNIKTQNRIRAKGGLTWEIIKGLTAKSDLSLSRNWYQEKDWDGGFTGDKVATLTKKDGYGVRWATTINYEVQGLGDDHSLSFLVGNEVLSSKTNSSKIKGAGYPAEFTMDDAFGMINMTDKDLGKDEFSNTIGTPTHTQSWFGRANYSYKGKYLLTATFRADGSSKFAPNNHWGYFPAAAAAWRLSDESFIKESAEDWLDNLKLRLSYGTSGSDNIDASLWKETWTTKNITVNGEAVTSYVPGDMLGNPDLKWERTISRNVGLDFGLWNSRLRGSLDFYWNTTKDILMKVPVDSSTGYTYQFQNVGQTSNKGFELSLGYDIFRSRDFNLSFNATYNFNKNNVDKLMDGVLCDTAQGWGSTMRKPTYDYIIREGQPVGLIQGYKSLGFYTPDDFNIVNGVWTLKEGVPDMQIIKNYVGGSYYNIPDGQFAFPGMAKYADTNEDGVVDESDATIIGKTQPKHTGGFSLSGNYKNFDFSANFTYQIGGKIYNANAMYSMMGNKDNSLGENRLDYVADCYKIFNVDSNGDLYAVTDPDELNELNKNAKYALNFGEYGITSSQFVEDASYLRFQTLTLGYTLPKTWLKKVGISNLRVYFTGNNLFCISGYSGLDPDVNTDTDGVNGFQTPNYDYQSYPKARTYTFGLNLTF